jgi:3-oxoacyl-[acyl-carrier protein] reductase
VGASSGIGAAVAQRFGALGVKLVVHCNENRDGAEAVVAAIRAAGGSAELIQANVAEAEGAAHIIDDAAKVLGGLDILVNNAGSMFGRTSIADATDEQYDKVINLNIGGVFFASRRAAQIMRAQRSGAIINTTSVAARTGGGDGAGLYGSAKGFVSTITRVLAIMTAFHERYSTPAQLEASVRGIPLGRLGTAEECVGAYEFLASERMSGYITGQVIEVNGGQLMP